jgi:hypothetical protein
LHASSDAPSVDIYANGNKIAQNLAYKDMTDYLAIPAGNYQIEVFPVGQTSDPVIFTNLSIPAGTIYTIAATGLLANLALYPIPEEYSPPANGRNSYVRFIHLSPDAPPVDVFLPNGSRIFGDVEYEEFTAYTRLNPGEYTLQVRPVGMDQAVLTVPNVKLSPGEIYSIYAVGLVGDEPSLEALLVSDNKSNVKNNTNNS